MLGADQSMPRQLLQNLRHQRRRNAVFLGDFIGATCMVLVAVHRQMLDSNKTVICLCRNLEHLRRHAPSATYTTESVGIKSMPVDVKCQPEIVGGCQSKPFIFN